MPAYWLVVLLHIFCLCPGKELDSDINDKNNYIIACHSTDFECFKRQYMSLRENVLMGNHQLGIGNFSPYFLRYGATGTCIRISGFEESVLKGISLNDGGHYLKLILEMPFKLQQLLFQNIRSCQLPEHRPLKRFTGNVTIDVTFPFYMEKNKGKLYLTLGEEGVDVILDIADLSGVKDGTAEDKSRYYLSEWAYEVVQHVNVAERFALPFMAQIRKFSSKVPIDRYLLLYPDEEYTNMYFKYSESPHFDAETFHPLKTPQKSID